MTEKMLQDNLQTKLNFLFNTYTIAPYMSNLFFQMKVYNYANEACHNKSIFFDMYKCKTYLLNNHFIRIV